jgi:hypothetical protein
VASNPGQIPAGGRDKISVKVSTRNHGGQTLHKGFTVFTNDPGKARVRLQVSGKIDAFLTVAPQFVRLIGRAGQPLQQSVKITPAAGRAFTIKDISVSHPERLRYKLKPIGNPPGRSGYELVVENAMQEAGNYHDRIILQTDSKEKPSIAISVYARIHDPAGNGNQKTN